MEEWQLATATRERNISTRCLGGPFLTVGGQTLGGARVWTSSLPFDTLTLTVTSTPKHNCNQHN
jgi:hypothetical protein